eukprot:gene8091-1334_t
MRKPSNKETEEATTVIRTTILHSSKSQAVLKDKSINNQNTHSVFESSALDENSREDMIWPIAGDGDHPTRATNEEAPWRAAANSDIENDILEDASGSLDEADFSDGIIVVLQRLSDAVWRERDIVTKAKSQLLKGAVRAVIIRGDHSLALSLYSLFLGMPWTLRVLQQVDSTLGVLHALFVGACPNWAEVESSMTPAEFEERNLAVVNSMGLVLNLWEQTSSNQQTNLAARTLLSRAQDKILPSIMRVVRLSCLRNGGPAGSSSCCTASSRGRDAGSWPPPALFPYASSVSIRLLQGLMIMSLCDSMHSPQAEGGVLHR